MKIYKKPFKAAALQQDPSVKVKVYQIFLTLWPDALQKQKPLSILIWRVNLDKVYQTNSHLEYEPFISSFVVRLLEVRYV